MRDTRALIGIKYKDGTIKGVLVEQHGYPGRTGIILYMKYYTKEKIEDLLNLGNILILGDEVHPDSSFPHYINISEDMEIEDINLKGIKEKMIQEFVTIAVHRDIRVNENGLLKKLGKTEPITFNSLEDLKKTKGRYRIKYGYIFDEVIMDWKTYGNSYKTGKYTRIDKDIDKYNYTLNALELEEMGDLSEQDIRSAEKRGYTDIRRYI